MNCIVSVWQRFSAFAPLLTALALSVLLPAAAGFAQGGPPMITDDTETVPKGHWEINMGFTVERGRDGRLWGLPLFDVNYGLSKHLQLKVEVPYLKLSENGTQTIRGLGNTNVGIRWRFRDEREHHKIALSIYPQFEFNNPTSSLRRGLVDKGPEFLMPLQVQTTIGKTGINGDIGYRFKRGVDEMIYGVVLGREVNEKLEILGEIHGTGPTRTLSDSEVVYNLGSRIGLTNHLTFITSAGRTIRRHFDPRFIGYAGMQITF